MKALSVKLQDKQQLIKYLNSKHAVIINQFTVNNNSITIIYYIPTKQPSESQKTAFKKASSTSYLEEATQLIEHARNIGTIHKGSGDRYIWELREKINNAINQFSIEKFNKAILWGINQNLSIDWVEFPSLPILSPSESLALQGQW
jgi:REP element-mobilizing transposase RayT